MESSLLDAHDSKAFQLKLHLCARKSLPKVKKERTWQHREPRTRAPREHAFLSLHTLNSSSELPYFCRFEQDLFPTVLWLLAHPKNTAFANLFRSSRLDSPSVTQSTKHPVLRAGTTSFLLSLKKQCCDRISISRQALPNP